MQITYEDEYIKELFIDLGDVANSRNLMQRKIGKDKTVVAKKRKNQLESAPNNIMEAKMSGLSREMIIHPGETLKEVLEDRNMSQQELALRTGVSPKHISTVLNGEKNISVSFAKKLEYALNIDAEFWINLQNAYDKEILEFDELNSISKEEISVLKQLKSVFEYLIEKTMIPICSAAEQKVLELRKFLNVSNLTSIPTLVSTGAFRTQTSVGVDEYTLFAWQKICEVLCSRVDVQETDYQEQKKRLLLLIPSIKKLMFESQEVFVPRLTALLSDNGIAFCIAPSFKGAPVQGFIKHISESKTILAMTFRQKKADIFWFTFFHEIGHLLNGDGKKKFIDFESVENVQEKKADEFVENELLNKQEYANFLRKSDFSLQSIKEFAKEQNVLPCIVIGRLQKEKYLKWSDYTEEMIMYSTSQ